VDVEGNIYVPVHPDAFAHWPDYLKDKDE
jgi:hypothetical protein